MILFGATFMRGRGGFTTARSDFNAARGDSESPTRAASGAELARYVTPFFKTESRSGQRDCHNRMNVTLPSFPELESSS